MNLRIVVPFAGAFVAALAYAVARYVVFGNVSVAHLPLFVMNKAIAVTALVVLAVALVVRDAEARRALGRAGLGIAAFHVLLTVPVVTPAYFPSLFAKGADAAGMLSARGELVLLLGAAAMIAWSAPSWSGPDSASPSRPLLRTGAVALVGLHAALLGWPSWGAPGSWPGHLPPITLICSLVALGGVVAAIAARRRGRP